MEKTTIAKNSKRLSREEWLALALDTVAKKGKAKLRVDSLVQSLGVTKGSFYWHFKNRDDFVLSLVNYWSKYSTEQVMEKVNRVRGDAKKRMYALMETVTRGDLGQYDLAMRAWATQEPEVANVVKTVDEQRLSFVRSIFTEMGFSDAELEMRTRTLVSYLSLELGLFVRVTKKERLKLLKLLHNLLTTPQGKLGTK